MLDPIALLQNWLANWASGVVVVLPVGYAFGAGMVSTVNPCGFTMLPAYLSLYMGTREGAFAQRAPLVRVARAVYIGGTVSLSFVALFGLVGLGIAAGGHFLLELMPWAGLATGVVLVAIGVLLFAGRHLHPRLVPMLRVQVVTSDSLGFRTFFLFGVGYAVASLPCTLPIFLGVVGSSFATVGTLAGLYQFITYALGMGLVLVGITLGMALFKGVTFRSLRVVFPYMERVSAALILLAGLYVIYYWLVKGDLLRYFT